VTTVVLAAVALGSCNRRGDGDPVLLSAIGPAPVLTDPARGTAPFPSELLRGAIAQGLVAFDASGQIEPGLAERWTVIDNGMSYIFRLRDAEWSDGRKVTAGDVVRVLRRQIAPGSRNPLAPYLTAIDEIVEMTPEVIEIRLKRPRPDPLKLFAQPAMGIFRERLSGGTGPYRVIGTRETAVTLRPTFDPARIDGDEIVEPGPEQNVSIIGERASRAIARFVARQSDLVLGGSFTDWPLVPLAGVSPANLRIDPAAGLFGIAIVRRDGFLAEAQNRAALAQAIDRAAIVAAFAPGWAPAEQVLPEQLDSAAAPAAASWQLLSPADRRAAARAAVQRWKQDHPGDIRLSIALPDGPGATILYGFVAAGLRSIGITLDRVPQNATADLALVDAVAPYDSARWYLATACQACADEVTAKLEAAREADTPADRARLIADADAALAQDQPFIVIARPLRWSLVALRLRAWQPNSRAWHPLNHLRGDTR
jgi:peptide/nickel transport system substrate-binding protein